MPRTTQEETIRTNCLTKFGDRTQFLLTFNPDRQVDFCKDTGRCYFGAAPTLGVLRTAYGENAPVAWLVPQLANLSEYCGCKDKLTAAQLEECAKVIASAFCHLKVTEFMLFFFQFKAGRYGRFYGNIDPLVITTSLRNFCNERNDIYFRHESDVRRIEQERQEEKTVTYEEYLAGISGKNANKSHSRG